MQNDNIQHQPIQELHLSESFKIMATSQHLETLSDLLALTPEQIMSIPNLTFKHLEEYRSFCKDHNLEHLQQLEKV